MKSSPTLYSFIRRFLLHTLIIWSAINIGSWLLYKYNILFNLAYTVNVDGSIISAKDQFISHNFHQPLIIWMLLIAFLAELNFLFLLQKKGLLWFATGSICLGLVGSAISMLFTTVIAIYPRAAQFLESTVAIILYVAGYSIAYNFFYERFYSARLAQKRFESELNLLKAQINPHFFFNTLNNLYGMALNENASKTAEGIELLSEMMRYNINGINQDYIELETELKFIENYVDLQRLRIPEKGNISIKINITHPNGQHQIAPMLLIPLIENAWQYGISMDQPCYINLNISVEDDHLNMDVANSIFPNQHIDKGAGLGVNNMKQQLDLLYPDRFKYTVEKDEKNYKINLVMNLKSKGQ